MRYFSLDQQKILLVLASLLTVALSIKFYHSPSVPSEKIIKEVVIEVLGEVRNPGVYVFHRSPTLREAIDKAGGLMESAMVDQDSISELLRTGALVNVRKGSQHEIRIKIETMEAHKLIVFSIPLDLNRVSAEDLCLIPGVGESLAKEIMTYREKRKGFRSVEELKNIKGIGDKKYQSLKNFLTVEAARPLSILPAQWPSQKPSPYRANDSSPERPGYI